MSVTPGEGLPVVSVIVPTAHADRAARLQSALASIWAQEGLGKLFDVEPIVIDDASRGPTEEVVRRFPGTRYIRFETNRGAAAARDAGLSAATGKYVAFLDDDDLWLPHRLFPQVAALEEAQGVEVAYSQQVRYDGATLRVYPGAEAPSGWIFETLAKQGYIANIEALLIPRTAVHELGGFDESLRVGQDMDFVARLSLLFPFRYVHGIGSIYLPSMTRRSPWEVCRAVLTTRDSILALIEGRPDVAELKRFVLCTSSWNVFHKRYVGREGLRGGEVDEARREFLRWVAEFRPLESDAWAKSNMREGTFLLGAASDLPADRASLSKELKRAAGARGLKQRLEMRALLADVWTEAALRFASGRRRDHRRAGSAAVRAILQNPLKPLSRPGLLRLVGRTLIPF